MIICICRRVSDVDIARQASLGKSFDQLRDELGVGAQCGRCACSARDIIDAHAPDAKLEVAERQALGRSQSAPNGSLEGAALLVAQACLGALSGGEPVASAKNSWSCLDSRGVSSLKGLDDSMKGLDAAIDAAFDKGRAKLEDTQLLAAAKSLDSNRAPSLPGSWKGTQTPHCLLLHRLQ